MCGLLEKILDGNKFLMLMHFRNARADLPVGEELAFK